MPRDNFMDEVVEGAPLKEKKKKRPRKKKQIAQSLPVVSRGRFRLKESPRLRKQMRKQICRMKRRNQWPPTEAELGVVQNGSTAAIMHGRFRQIYDDEVRAKRKYDSGASARCTARRAASPPRASPSPPPPPRPLARARQPNGSNPPLIAFAFACDLMKVIGGVA